MTAGRAMRVLHVTRDFPPRCTGGISTAVGGLVRAQVRAGVRCAVVSFDGWRPRGRPGRTAAADTAAADAAADAAAVDAAGRNDCTSDGQPDVIARLSSRDRLAEATAFAEAFAPAIVHVHDAMLWPWADALAARLASATAFTVHVLHAEQERLRGLSRPTASGLAERRALAEADRVIAPSRGVARVLSRERLPALAGDAGEPLTARLRVVGLGVDDTPGARRAAARGPEPIGPVVYAGRFADMRGTPELFAAIPRIARAAPGVRFAIAGGVPDNPRAEARWLRQLADAIPAGVRERVEHVGWLAPEALSRLYARAQVVIAPSWFETFGLAVLEAMLHGRPVVAADVGGLSDLVVHGETGVLCPPRDVDALVAATRRLLGDLALARRLGHAAARVARAEHLWPRAVTAQLAVYGELIRAAPARALDERIASADARANPPAAGDSNHDIDDASNDAAAADRHRLRLPRGMPLREGLIAAFRAIVDHAVASALDPGLAPDVRVHEFRRAIRRARALLRLLRGVLAEPDHRALRDALGSAHRATSELRDDAAVHDAIALVEREHDDASAPRSLRAALQEDAATSGADDTTADVLTRCADAVTRQPEALAAALPARVEWRHVREGLVRGYRRARDAMRAADASREASMIHEWRKRNKELTYQLELLGADAGTKPRALRRKFRAVSSALGDVADLALLEDRVARDGDTSADAPAMAAIAAIAVIRRERAERAFARGAKAMSRGPERFARRAVKRIRAGRGHGEPSTD